MTIDMSKYLGLYVTESTEHLEALGRDLVKLERDRGPEVVDSLFRHAPSVKGMAASMGFEATATLAHRVEDLADSVRSDPSKTDRDLIDLLLSATDVLLTQVRAAGEGRTFDDSEALLARLSERVAQLTGQKPQPTKVATGVVVGGKGSAEPPATVEAAPLPLAVAPPVAAASVAPAPPSAPRLDGTLGQLPRFSIKVRIAASCAVPGVRGFLLHKRLSSLGNVFDLRPSLEDLKAGRIPDGLVSLELESTAGEPKISATLQGVSEVEVVAFRAIALVTAHPPPLPPPTAPETSRVVGQEGGARTVRVRAELLDYFLDNVGELLLATARIREVGKLLPERIRPVLDESVDQLHTLVKDLHDKVMKARMTPLSVIADRLPRAARDIARRREREVDLVVNGAEIELDRSIIDDLADPLLHLLRNCIDHGLESPAERVAAKKDPKGRVLINVRRHRDRVVLEIEDDGRGMDASKLKNAALARGLLTAEQVARMGDREAYLLACLPGVSTATELSEISGRGVGMDSVKRTVENLGGTLEIESEKGRGTRFTLRLPLTVAVVNLLLVGVGDELYGLPIAKVLGAVEADPSALSESREISLLSHAGALLPVHPLAELLAVPSGAKPGRRPYVVMEDEAGAKVALAVDALLGQQEVVLKALSPPLDLLPGLSGVTILGTGRPVFILDVPRLLAA